VRLLMFMAIAAGVAFVCPAWGQPVTPGEGRAFFERYVALGDAFDPSLADLYLDESRILTLRRYPTGQERKLEMTGTQWKRLVRAAMPVARAKGDRSTYRDVRFEAAGRVLRARADRYSVLKCYWDKNYYMLIARQLDGQLRIVEEYTETQPQSDC